MYKSLMLLPNGAMLYYAMPYDKGNQYRWWRYDHDFLQKHKPKNKEDRIKIGLWSSKSSMHVIACDFDHLPIGFANFSMLHVYLTHRFINRGVVAYSVSGKVKVFFVIELENDHVLMSKEVAEHVIHRLFDYDDDFLSQIDMSTSALSTTFASKDIIFKLTKLQDVHIHTPEVDFDVKRNKYIERLDRGHNLIGLYRIYEGEINNEQLSYFFNKPRIRLKEERERFIRILLATPQLMTSSGFDLPQTKLSAELGVSTDTVNKWIKFLLKCNFLNIENTDYKKGVKAITYVASGCLLNELSKIYRDYKQKDRPSFPNYIKDGDWDRVLFEHAVYYLNAEGLYMERAKNLPTFSQKKDREYKLKHALKSWKKYISSS